jgi:hypothetical protein
MPETKCQWHYASPAPSTTISDVTGFGMTNQRTAAANTVIDSPIAERRRRSWVNWTFALLTVPGAALVVAVVAVIAVVGSLVTTRRRRGFAVPVLAWTLLAAAVAVLAVSFRP